MRRWLPFVIMAASLGVSPAQDVASPDAADLDLDLVKLKSGPKGRQREAMRKVLLLVHLKQKETWLAESTGDEAVHLAAEISFRRYLASVDMDGCPEEFRRAFLRSLCRLPEGNCSGCCLLTVWNRSICWRK